MPSSPAPAASPLGLTLRPFRSDDAPALAALFHASVREVGRRDYGQAQVEAWSPAPPDPERYVRQAEGRLFLVAVNAAGEPVGYGDLEPDGHLDHLYVRPDVAGGGVGSALVAALEQAARGQGLSKMFVEASEAAKRLFLRHGFEVVERRDFELRGVAIHNFRMRKRLDPAPGREAHPPLRSFGRLKSRPIKPRQAALVETLLPRIAVDLAAPSLGMGDTWLEIGFGGGEHMAEQAARRPEVRILGAEPFLNGAASALRHIDERGLTNVRLHVGDARELLAALPDASLARVFILFPDPWPKVRHHKRRLVNAGTAAELARVLRPGGSLRFATDWGDYADAALFVLRGEPRLRWTAETADDWRTPPADHVTTRYETKKLGDIAPVFLDFERA